jgi:hypothetical protein
LFSLPFFIVLLVAGLGFALHVLWELAVLLLVLWLVGLAIGCGEGTGSPHFYRWSSPLAPLPAEIGK